jgi:hypothetical protein
VFLRPTKLVADRKLSGADAQSVLEAKIKLVADRKLSSADAQAVIDVSTQEFDVLTKVIADCNANSKHYGAEETKMDVEYRCDQLGKQTHMNTTHYTRFA